SDRFEANDQYAFVSLERRAEACPKHSVKKRSCQLVSCSVDRGLWEHTLPSLSSTRKDFRPSTWPTSGSRRSKELRASFSFSAMYEIPSRYRVSIPHQNGYSTSQLSIANRVMLRMNTSKQTSRARPTSATLQHRPDAATSILPAVFPCTVL